ncbi:MAG: Nif11-like leader peptide family natural product precursor [Coleofasciculus sp. S288]|nr:Nif11-like leader peptide family natural product precursor [Coleofasciculus sp. S288]
MSTEKAIEFLAEVSENSSLNERLQQIKTPEDIAFPTLMRYTRVLDL